jgi:hypothetical protein
MTFKREAWVTYGTLVPVVLGVVIATWVSGLVQLEFRTSELHRASE